MNPIKSSDPSRRLLSAERVLVLCPHTDDEYGCAGTIARMIEYDVQIHYMAFSRCEESVPPGYEIDTLEKECLACTTTLGIAPENVTVGRFRVRHFPSQRQEILEELVRINREFQPELVLLPSSFDTHQDHATICAEGFRAFKNSTLLGYELPQNIISFENSAFIRLTPDQLDLKIRALSCYKSQASRGYARAEFIRSLALVRGVQCSGEYAEAYELVRLIL